MFIVESREVCVQRKNKQYDEFIFLRFYVYNILYGINHLENTLVIIKLGL